VVKQNTPADTLLQPRTNGSRTRAGKNRTPGEEAERNRYSLNPAKIKPGDLMAFINYVKVKRVDPEGPSVQVESIVPGQGEFAVRGEKLLAGALSADQYQEEEKVTMTRAAEILITSFNRPLTVRFVKKQGGERVLRGRLLRPEPLLGRSYVEDLDAPANSRIRLVDHRTIKCLIVDGVKYTVKGRKR
jgi:hypothetical protein